MVSKGPWHRRQENPGRTHHCHIDFDRFTHWSPIGWAILRQDAVAAIQTGHMPRSVLFVWLRLWLSTDGCIGLQMAPKYVCSTSHFRRLRIYWDGSWNTRFVYCTLIDDSRDPLRRFATRSRRQLVEGELNSGEFFYVYGDWSSC